MKLFIILLTLVSILFARTYNFTETRYSDAFDDSVHLKGLIEFQENSLKINYENDNREILYEDSALVIKQNEELLDIDEYQAQKVSSFFEVLLLLYGNNTALLEKHFIVKHRDTTIVLTPRDGLLKDIEKLTLQKPAGELKEVKLFLKNSDYIKISIEDEIR